MRRLYHRRSSVYRDRAALIGAAAASSTPAGCSNGSVAAGGGGTRNMSHPQITVAPSQLQVTTTTPGYKRQRSHSMFVADDNAAAFSLCVPLPRSRSNSFSGVQASRRSSAFALVAVLTDKEEDYIFNCYAKVMYLILGLTAMLLIFVVIHTMQAIFRL